MVEVCANPSRSHYVQGCRCAGCTKANREYSKKTRLYGFESSFVDAAPVRAHIAKLLAMGYSYNEIGRLSGVCDSTMRAIMTKHHRSGKPVGKVNREAA